MKTKTLSQVIQALTALLEKHGDVPVLLKDADINIDPVTTIEYSNTPEDYSDGAQVGIDELPSEFVLIFYEWQ